MLPIFSVHLCWQPYISIRVSRSPLINSLCGMCHAFSFFITSLRQFECVPGLYSVCCWPVNRHVSVLSFSGKSNKPYITDGERPPWPEGPEPQSGCRRHLPTSQPSAWHSVITWLQTVIKGHMSWWTGWRCTFKTYSKNMNVQEMKVSGSLNVLSYALMFPNDNFL